MRRCLSTQAVPIGDGVFGLELADRADQATLGNLVEVVPLRRRDWICALAVCTMVISRLLQGTGIMTKGQASLAGRCAWQGWCLQQGEIYVSSICQLEADVRSLRNRAGTEKPVYRYRASPPRYVPYQCVCRISKRCAWVQMQWTVPYS